MTIFRCNLINPDKLAYQFVSSNEPDLIGIEVMLDGNVLIDISMNERGEASVFFDQNGGSMEFDLSELRSVLDKCENELSAWRSRLTVPGAIWSEQ